MRLFKRIYAQLKRALLDFKFNERVLEETDEVAKFQVNLSGTHTSVIDSTSVLRGMPVVQPTGKQVSLPSRFFTYYVRAGKIVKTIGAMEIPHGIQLTVPPTPSLSSCTRLLPSGRITNNPVMLVKATC